MSEPLPFGEEIRDAMQEICNIAMGAAGESLAGFSGVFVELPIPKIRFVKPESVTEALAGLRGEDKISGVIRTFDMGETRSYAMVAITDTGLDDLAQQRQVSVASEAEAVALLNELAQVITETCLPMLAEQLEIDTIEMAPLQLVANRVPLEDVTIPQLDAENKLLSAEINYHLEGHPFNCDLLLLMPETGLERTLERLADLL